MYISEDDVQDKSFKIEIIFLEMLKVTNADLIDDCWSEKTDVSGNYGKAETTGKFENWSLEAGNTVTCSKKAGDPKEKVRKLFRFKEWKLK